MEKLRSIIGFLRMLTILFLCNAGMGFFVFAEGVELLSIGGPKPARRLHLLLHRQVCVGEPQSRNSFMPVKVSTDMPPGPVWFALRTEPC